MANGAAEAIARPAELTIEGLRRCWKGGALGSPTRSQLLPRQRSHR